MEPTPIKQDISSTEPVQGKNINLLLTVIKNRYVPVISAIVVLMIIGQLISPGFASLQNINNLLSFATILAFACIGQTIVIISGKEGFDMSVGAMMSMGALMGAAFTDGNSSHLLLALFGLIILGATFGFINAMGIYVMHIPPLVMTMGMATVLNGLVIAYTKGTPMGSVPPLLIELGSGRLFGVVSWLILLGIVIVILIEAMLRRTSYGKNLYLIGSNRQASLFSGVKVGRTVILTYTLAGVFSTVSGMVLVSKIGSAQLEMGSEYTLLTIAAVVIGGTQLSGGKGSFLGSALGSVLMVIIISVLIALNSSAGIKSMIQGLILLFILIIYSRGSKISE